MHYADQSLDHAEYTTQWEDETSFYQHLTESMDRMSDLPDFKQYNSSQSDILHLNLSLTDYSTNNNNEFKPETYDNKDWWSSRKVKQWDSWDVLKWINSVALSIGVFCTDINGHAFSKLDGYRLMEMSEYDFEKCDQKFGKTLYRQFRLIVSKEEPSLIPTTAQMTNYPYKQTYTDLDSAPEGSAHMNNRLSPTINFNKNDSFDREVTQTSIKDEETQHYTVSDVMKCRTSNDGEKKKGPGRPKLQRKKKKPEKKLGRLWEFIRDLLKDREHCPKIICWENHDEGTFRFVHSDKVAKLWGRKKENPEMNYEKLSRAMRYYYKSNVLQAVLGRRLVYKFGPNAKGWRCENPNFKN